MMALAIAERPPLPLSMPGGEPTGLNECPVLPICGAGNRDRLAAAPPAPFFAPFAKSLALSPNLLQKPGSSASFAISYGFMFRA